VTAVSPPPLALGELPDAVRARVVGLAADVLPDVVRLPPPLRRVAGFAPQRRARLGGTAIAEALEADDELRERVGTQVAARASFDLATGGDQAAGDPVEVAALAWLVRPEGWEQLVASLTSEILERRQAASRDSGEADRLRERLAQAEQATRELRQRSRAQIEELKVENASLRRKLGESRAAERAAREVAEGHEVRMEEARTRAASRSAVQDKELRRLRDRVAELEAEVAAGRRAVRSERDEVTVRARLLLETVIDAASGLRRELALPAVEGAPGDRLEADLGRTAQQRAAAGGATGAAGSGTAAQLERVLALPRARLVVDGYNVSKTAWPSAPLEAQRNRLLAGLAPVVARLGVETTVVFDAAAASARTSAAAPRGVKVVFSPEGVIADDVIRDLVAAEPTGRVVVVVSSDREVAADVSRCGARAFAAGALVGLLS